MRQVWLKCPDLYSVLSLMLKVSNMVGDKIFVLNKESKGDMSTKAFPGTLQ